MSARAVERVRACLKSHPSTLYTPSSLAGDLLGESISSVRAALEQLRASGELVSCRVIRSGVEDEEFRVSASVPRPTTADPHTPSAQRMAAPDRRASAPRKRAPIRNERSMWQGAYPLRQRAIVDIIESLGRPVFPSELLARFRSDDPLVAASVIYCSIQAAMKRGLVVRCPKRLNTAMHLSSYRYGTPAIAERAEVECNEGSGGEAGDGKAAPALGAAAPSGDEATRPSAKKTAPKGVGVRAGPVFGLLPDHSLAIRSIDAGLDLSPEMTRALLAWLDGRAGTRLVEKLLP